MPIRRLSKSHAIQIGLGIALVTAVLLGIRSFGYEHSGRSYPRIGLNPKPPDGPTFHVSCDPIISEIFHASDPNCHSIATEKVPGLLIQSLAVGLVALAILLGLARSSWGRPIEPATPDSSSQIAAQLERLVLLRQSGDLSDDEFAAAKRSLLG